MLTLKEALQRMFPELPMPNGDIRLYCATTDAVTTMCTFSIQGYLAAYSFTLVTKGTLTLQLNAQQLTLQPNTLYTYYPGLPISVIHASDDYQAICLLADEHTTIETTAAHHLVHLAYQPLVQLHQPVVELTHDQALQTQQRILELQRYIHADHPHRNEIVRMLYAVFLLELHHHRLSHQPAPSLHLGRRGEGLPRRHEEIFTTFMELLPQHFAQHHDIAFYASRLSVSPVYLSRVVREVTSRTVISYVNQMLIMEAAFLLDTTTLTVAQIADRLHFADKASFTKFFSRLKGTTPRKYRHRAEP